MTEGKVSSGNPASPWNGSAQHRRYEENYNTDDGDGGSEERQYGRGPNEVPDDQTYTFEDVESGMLCFFKGREAIIGQKGAEIVPSTRGRHLVLYYTDDNGTDERRIHEALVNKYLYQKKKLWVDFEHRMNNYTTEDN
jgi:hypothetical protein